ncbi:MAG: hypothetical protein ACRDHW_04935 [Ktedonobacteraceae bacterium]
MRMNVFLPLLCLGLVLLAGCGYNGNATTSTGNSATATSVPRVTPATSPTATVMPTGTHASGSGGVSVHLSASGYHAHDTIVVTITNGTSQTISFADHQSNCTIVLLQRQNATTWEPVSLCKLMILTRILSMDAGKSQTVSLHAPASGWQTGMYRVSFSYNGGASASRSPVAAASSPVFQVN